MVAKATIDTDQWKIRNKNVYWYQQYNEHVSWYGNIKSFGTCYILQHKVLLLYGRVVLIILIMEEEEEMVERQFNSIEEDGRKAYWLMKIHCFDLMNTVRYIFMNH